MKKLISLANLVPGKKTVNAVNSSFTVTEKNGAITKMKTQNQTVVFSGGQIVRISS